MKKIAKFSVEWHRRLRWYGGITILLWSFSGMLHPFMSWTGPKAQSFFPPQFSMAGQDVQLLTNALARARQVLGIESAKIVKVVPSKEGPVLQLTEEHFSERHYLSLSDAELLPDYDQQQARWLASYYTGRPEEKIASVTKIDAFSAEYPWVNRLLPVYRVAYAGDDDLVAFVHTETSALASLTNNWKTSLQVVFKALHTWDWLDFAGFGRVLIVSLLMLSMFAMAVTGMALVASFPWRKISDIKRRWHHILAYFIWLPLLAWVVSGFYHLLQAQYIDRPQGLRLGNELNLGAFNSVAQGEWFDPYRSINLNSVSLVSDGQSGALLRLGVAQPRGGKVSREQKYSGKPVEKGSYYLDLATASEVTTDDRLRVSSLAASHGVEPNQIEALILVTRFGPNYDFRNKRLPVWQVSVDDENRSFLFIDPVTGILVDQARGIDRIESWSFSVLHKWSFFNAFTSRQVRDVIIVCILLLGMLFTTMGMLIQVRQKKKKAAAIPVEQQIA